jgi:ABC-2 type transport system permease protein
VSLEGSSFWIIRSAPLSISDFLWAKFWSSLLPLLVLGETLIILSNLLLKVTSFMMALGIITVFMMTFGITSLGVGLGAAFPKFKYENAAQIPSGFGGIVYMITSLLYIGTVILLEVWPVYRIFTALTFRGHISYSGWGLVLASFSLLLAVHILAFLLPFKIGLNRLKQREV